MIGETRLIIHTGTHKTGTTSIQAFLKFHQEELSVSDNIHYLEFNIPKKYEIPFANSYDVEIFHEIKSYLNKNIQKGKTNIISHEGFSGNPMEFYENYKIPPKILFDATIDYKPTVIVFFRRQDLFIQSCFLQYRSRGHRFQFSDFYDRGKLENLNWLKMANYYSDLFGRDQVRISLYDPTLFLDKTLIHLFGEIIGSDLMADSNSEFAQNVALSKESLEVFDKISRLLTPAEKGILKFELQANFSRGIGSHYDLLEADEVAYIETYFSESNKKLAESYCKEQSFSDISYGFKKPEKFLKHHIYMQLISDLFSHKSDLYSKKLALLKSYLHSSRIALRNKIKN